LVIYLTLLGLEIYQLYIVKTVYGKLFLQNQYLTLVLLTKPLTDKENEIIIKPHRLDIIDLPRFFARCFDS
jgi:hypothetical protein